MKFSHFALGETTFPRKTFVTERGGKSFIDAVYPKPYKPKIARRETDFLFFVQKSRKFKNFPFSLPRQDCCFCSSMSGDETFFVSLFRKMEVVVRTHEFSRKK